MYKTKFDSSKINYLLDCDTILKYNLKNKYEIPKLKKLSFQISLKDILLASDFINKETFNRNIQIKGILLLYLINSNFPSISFYNYKNARFLKDKNSGDFIIRMDISDKKVIEYLLKELCLNNIELFNTKKNINAEKFLSYNLKISARFFQNITNYFERTNSLLNLNKIEIQLNLLYKNSIKTKKNIITNVLKTNSFFG